MAHNTVTAFCGCKNGTRENLIPEAFLHDGSTCLTCDQPWTLAREA